MRWGPSVEQVAAVREALGNLAVTLDTRRLARGLGLASKVSDREAFRDSLPALLPPLSATIIAEREDRF